MASFFGASADLGRFALAHNGMNAIAATAARLSGLDACAGFDVGLDRAAGGIELAGIGRDGHLDAWLSLLAARHGHRGTAGSLLGGALIRAVIEPTVWSMVVEGRCPDPAVENLAVRRDADGELERVVVLGPTLAVLADDPVAGDPHTVVVDGESALLHWWARRATATLVPLLAAVRARAPFGLPALWGGVSDEITGTGLWIGQLAGREPGEVWSQVQRMRDVLAAYAPVRMTRARPFPVAGPADVQWFQVRGTCCLSYRSITDAGPIAERYCSSCPLRDDGSRCRLLRDHLHSLST